MKARNLLLGTLIFAIMGAYAHDFTATVNGQRLYFEITNKNKKTVFVTYDGRRADKKTLDIDGIVEIPAKIKHDNVVYDVNAIGQKAFANANTIICLAKKRRILQGKRKTLNLQILQLLQ